MDESGGYSPFDYISYEEGRVAAYVPDDFKQYVDTQFNRCPLVQEDFIDYEDIFPGWVFWSREDDQSEHPPNILDLKKKIKDVLRRCILDGFLRPMLYQFWAPKKTMDGRSYLTTQNQPFALTPVSVTRIDDVKGLKGLCGYRMISKDYKFYMDRESSDEQLGVPGRVFKQGFPEFSPNVEYYSIKEYPLRHQALRCQVKLSLAYPLFDPSNHLCVGVLEIVSTALIKDFFFENIYDWLFLPKEVGLESSISHADDDSDDTDLEVGLESSISHADDDTDDTDLEVGLKSSISQVDHHMDSYLAILSNQNVRQSEALDEINKVLEVVCEVHDLPLAQAWVPCEVDCTRWALVKGDIFHVIRQFRNGLEYCNFWVVNSSSHLRKWQGVVGRAFSSPNVLFCKDVTQLSIIDYPLAHFARDEELGGCFAICLQSSCTGNDIYVLECFVPPSNKDYYGNQQTALRKILETMKKNFHTFKLASGEEVGGHLYIEEIPFHNGEKLDSVQMSQTTKSLPRLEPLQSGGEMTQLDLSNQQSMDALNNESNVVSAERSNIDVTCSQEKGQAKRPKRVHNKIGVKIEIPLDDILQNSNKRMQVAAENLQVSKSTLKRACRDYGFPRWPPRKKKMVGSSQPSESSLGVDHQQIPQLSSDQPLSQASTAVVHSNPHNTVIQDANIVTVKARYINDIIIKFQLPLSSGLVELHQQIAKRLNLEARSYYVKYKDEEDHMILIACDDDLQNCISTYRLLGISIVLLVEPKSITIDQMMASFEESMLFE